jgi:hypothetical protein
MEAPERTDSAGPAAASARPSYWLTRFVMLRVLGLVYFVAFLVAALQVKPLLGHDGLLPVDLWMSQVESVLGSRGDAFLRAPSLFWLHASDAWLVSFAWVGVALSLVVACGYASSILLFVLWALYMSYVHVGQDWYGFGWEIQLLETGFLAIFLVPLLDGRPFPRRAPPVVVIWLMRWLIARIMLGAGLIKLRGDPCWRDLTCLDYHYETQPIPNPFSRTLHFMPHWFSAAGVLWNHVTELLSPWLMICGRRARLVGGAIMLSLQVMLIGSGNLSFLNYLTIVPILACFDDRLLARVLPRRLVARAQRAAAEAQPSRAQHGISIALAVVVGMLSIAPVANLLSGHQVMNTSFEPFDLVNTYGAFGSVGKERLEVIMEGTSDESPDASAHWVPYEFKAKPGDPLRRPPIISPYHLRLDWMIWFAAMSGPDEHPWLVHLAWKLLHGDHRITRLLAGDPFPDAPPRFIRIELYRYRFARPGNAEGAWWERERVGEWLPPIAADDERVRGFLTERGLLRDHD